MIPPKSIMIGGAGLIGGALLAAHRKIYADCLGTTRHHKAIDPQWYNYLDLLNPDISPLNLAKQGYKEAIISAGISKLLLCEQQKKHAQQVTEGTIRLIKQLCREGIKPIYLSSDVVFNGINGGYKEEAELKPVCEYARQKVMTEQYIKEVCKENFLIVRLSKVFTLEKGDGTIFDEMASALSAGRKIKAAYDQVFSPTLLADTVNAILCLQSKGSCGIFNLSSPEVWNRYDLAIKMADYLGANRNLVERISLDQLQESFTRPKNTSMNTTKLSHETGYKFTAIDECLKKISSNYISASATK